MADEPKPEDKKPNFLSKLFSGQGGLLGGLLEKVGVRGVMYQLGGRKVVAGAGALTVISQIVASDMADWPKAFACLGAAAVAAVVAFSISSEDSKKAQK